MNARDSWQVWLPKDQVLDAARRKLNKILEFQLDYEPKGFVPEEVQVRQKRLEDAIRRVTTYVVYLERLEDYEELPLCPDDIVFFELDPEPKGG